MNTVLQEVASDRVDPAHIRERVADWRRRIDRLYTDIAEWVPSRLRTLQTRSRPMDEELMRESRIAPVTLPILDILDGDETVATLEPRGLWIIGANGRLDLVTGNRHFIIVDGAENFAEPRWAIAPLADRTSMVPLTKDAFLSVLHS